MNFTLDWLRDKDSKKRASDRKKKQMNKEKKLSKDYHDDPSSHFGANSFSQWKKSLEKVIDIVLTANPQKL